MNLVKLKKLLPTAKDIALEILWPTRCAVCDLPGEHVLCESCISKLIVVDECLACPRCGSPYGIHQCTECNDVSMAAMDRKDPPFERMVHSLVLDEAARKIASIYKDSDERRLAGVIAQFIANSTSPELKEREFTATFIPDSKKARRRRGFDHSEEIATEFCKLTGLECRSLFDRPDSADQRELGRKERTANMRGRITVTAGLHDMPENVLVVDDVCTTGATIYAACEALLESGCKSVQAITFAQAI